MKRIDAALAEQIENAFTEKLKSQAPSAGTEPALRGLIEGLRAGKPNDEDMEPSLAEATRQQLPNLHADIGGAGSIQSIGFVGVGNSGADVYCVQHEHRTMYWRIALGAHGKIAMAWVSPGI